MAFYIISKQNYANALLLRECAAQLAFQRHGDRWLGLWSSADEAVNSLAALAPKGASYEWLCAADGARDVRPPTRDSGRLPLPKLTVPHPVTATHLLPDVHRFAPHRIMKPVVWLMNRWLEPLWRSKIATTLTRTCQGSDLPAAELAFVSPWPLPLAAAAAHPGLPPDTDTRLECAAAGRSGELRPALRELLMNAALQGVPAAVRHSHRVPPVLQHHRMRACIQYHGGHR